jgi:transcription initiation factor TFIIIB Brf1 subunit/transcription initiation factor TFIIB
VLPSLQTIPTYLKKTKRQAFNIMKEVTENKIFAGKHPMGLAATVLLYIIYKNW